MDQIKNIKAWLQELSPDKKLHEDSILIGRDPAGGTRITLLGMGCCQPAARIEKKLDDIRQADVAAIAHLMRHKH